jgi:hypothetical protein
LKKIAVEPLERCKHPAAAQCCFGSFCRFRIVPIHVPLALEKATVCVTKQLDFNPRLQWGGCTM